MSQSVFSNLLSNGYALASFCGAIVLSIALANLAKHLKNHVGRSARSSWRGKLFFGICLLCALLLWWLFAVVLDTEMYMSVQKAAPT